MLSRSLLDRLLASPLGEAAYGVVETLTDAGYDAWWVGGCVRDLLQEKLPTDIDIGTSATPEQALGLFTRSAEASRGLGSVRVHGGPFVFEVTTFRSDDDDGNGRRPASVTFSTREHDAARRDFTVNALYVHPISRELYDPFGGEADLREKLIRFIGDPAMRIAQDALRMLRAVRFRALLDGQYHPETYRALQAHAGDVATLSGFRILEELEKMLAGPRPDRALEDLWELHILHAVLPELAACKGVPQPADYHREGDVWEHLLACTRAFQPDDSPDVRLAALLHDCGKVQTFSLKERIRFDEHASVSADLTRSALDRLQCPARRRDAIAWLIEHHMMMGSFAAMNDDRKAHWYYHPLFPQLLRLFELDIAGTTPSGYTLYNSIVQDYNAFLDAHPRPQKPLLSGQDIMDILGLPPGEHIGVILQKLHAQQTAGAITTKKEARAFVEGLKNT